MVDLTRFSHLPHAKPDDVREVWPRELMAQSHPVGGIPLSRGNPIYKIAYPIRPPEFAGK
jgi:hypothetical protein